MRFKTPAPLRAAALAGLLGLLGASAHAFEDGQRGFYVEGGRAPHGQMGNTNAFTVGMTLPWSPRQPVQEGALTAYWDVFLSDWHAPALDDGRRDYVQIGAIYTWRWRFAHGTSPWYVEGGVGGSVMDHVYRTPDRSFGEHGEHDLSLRVQHFSNGGIKKPNPGENFVRVRYTYHF